MREAVLARAAMYVDTRRHSVIQQRHTTTIRSASCVLRRVVSSHFRSAVGACLLPSAPHALLVYNFRRRRGGVDEPS